MDLAPSNSLTFNLDIAKCIEPEEVITVSSILISNKPIFPSFRTFAVGACQRVEAGKQTAPMYIRSVISVLSRTSTMSQFPLHGLTIKRCPNCYVSTH